MAPALTREFRPENSEGCLESKADGHASNAQQSDQVACPEGRRNDGKCNQKSQNKNAGADQLSEQQGYALMLFTAYHPTPGERCASGGEHEKYQKNDNSQSQIWQERNGIVDDFYSGLPGIGEIDRHDSLR